MQMKVASFFAGVGGIDSGFEKAGFKTTWANEIDSYASQTFKSNFSCDLVVEDIKGIKIKEIPNFKIMIGGFPCQSFSLAGYRRGFDDERGNLFFELAKIIEVKMPEIVFLENVKNLVGHDNGNTFRVILDCLKDLGYKVRHKVLNACEYGNIPQNRERIYVIAFKDENVANRFEFPDPIQLTTKLSDVIDFEGVKEDRYYYTEENCSFYNLLKEEMTKDTTIYQWRRIYVRENKSNVCPTLTANMGTGGHNVPLIKTSHGIRKLTPRECFNLQGFSKEFVLPSTLSNTRLYKQAGNSVAVPVIEILAKQIRKALKK